jgi:uncharacterized membrane protein
LAVIETVMASLADAKDLVRTRQRRLVWKTVVVCVVVVGTNVLGNYALKRGLDHVGVIETWSVMPYIRAFFEPWVAVGVAVMVGWIIARLSLLSWADLTYVLPVTSFSYVFSAVAGAVYLHERVASVHWAGICFVTVGVALVAPTSPGTVNDRELDK